MNIRILGRGEKRAVVYPLLHILNNFGGGLLISDDGMYRRVVTDKDGFVGNVRLFVGAKTSHAALKSEGIYTYGYDTVIRDTDEIFEDIDVTIRVCRAYPDDGERIACDYEVCADFVRGNDKKPFIPLTVPLLRELRDIEVSGRFGAFRNAAAVKTLCPIFADIFSVSSSAIKNLLRKGGALT